MYQAQRIDGIGNIHELGGTHKDKKSAEREAENRNSGKKHRSDQDPWWVVVKIG